MFRDKTASIFEIVVVAANILQALCASLLLSLTHSGSLCSTLAHSCCLWLTLALSGSLWLPLWLSQALISSQGPCSPLGSPHRGCVATVYPALVRGVRKHDVSPSVLYATPASAFAFVFSSIFVFYSASGSEERWESLLPIYQPLTSLSWQFINRGTRKWSMQLFF